MTFLTKLQACCERSNSLLCLGLDPDLESLPDGYSRDVFGVELFNRTVIEATSDLVCAYKPNLAFYEALGIAGLRTLEATLAMIPTHVPTIADGKRGDIENTSRLYARAIFDTFGFDSATVNAYMGRDSLQPFFDWAGKGVWVVCRTSNPGAADLQALVVNSDGPPEPLWVRVLRMVQKAPSCADKGVVIGATLPEDIRTLRGMAPDMPLLIPGVGAQGGDAGPAVGASATGPVVINASRSILYQPGASDPGAAIRSAAERLRDQLNSYR